MWKKTNSKQLCTLCINTNSSLDSPWECCFHSLNITCKYNNDQKASLKCQVFSPQNKVKSKKIEALWPDPPQMPVNEIVCDRQENSCTSLVYSVSHLLSAAAVS